MSDSVNKTFFMGGLYKDVEINGEGKDRHAVMSIVTTDGYKDDEGNWIETKDFHTVKTWLPHKVNYLEKHGRKGAGIFVECKHSTRKVGEGDNAKFYDNFTSHMQHTLTITRFAKDQDDQ